MNVFAPVEIKLTRVDSWFKNMLYLVQIQIRLFARFFGNIGLLIYILKY